MKRFFPSCLLVLLVLSACAQSTPTPQVENTTPAETQIVGAAQTQEATTPAETQIASAEQTLEATSASQTQEATAEQTESATTEFAVGAKTPTQLCAAAVPAADPATRQFAQAEQILKPGVDY